MQASIGGSSTARLSPDPKAVGLPDDAVGLTFGAFSVQNVAPSGPAVAITVVNAPAHPPVPFFRALTLRFLGLLGFDPDSTTPNNPFLAAAWGLYRRTEAFFANERPTVGVPTVQSTELVDGAIVVHGSVAFDDFDGDVLKYTITPGANATVTSFDMATGQFVVRVANPAQPAVFTVKASDTGFHFHGLAALFGGGHTTTASFRLDVQDTGLSIVDPQRGDQAANGSFGGSFEINSLDIDTASVTVSDPPEFGILTYQLGPIDGPTRLVTYTYTPTDALRLRAGLTPALEETDAFAFTITDGVNAPRAVGIDHITVVPSRLAAGSSVANVGRLPTGIAIVGNHLFVTNFLDNTVTVYDVTTGDLGAFRAQWTNPISSPCPSL